MNLIKSLSALFFLALIGASLEAHWPGTPALIIQLHGALLLVLALMTTTLLASLLRQGLERTS